MKLSREALANYIEYMSGLLEERPNDSSFDLDSFADHKILALYMNEYLNNVDEIGDRCHEIFNHMDNFQWWLSRLYEYSDTDQQKLRLEMLQRIEQIQNHLRLISRIKKSKRLIHFDFPRACVIPRGSEEVGKQTLQSTIKGATKLTICDPYLFHTPRNTTSQEYAEQLISILPCDSLLELTLFYQAPQSRSSLGEFANRVPKHILLNGFMTNNIHDRVWIINDSRAIVVGTSFGGLGKKYSFLLDLPDDDLNEFKSFLEEIKEPKDS